MSMTEIHRLVYYVPANRAYTIDLARDLSVTRRKLHRQKMTYTVLGGQMQDSSGCNMTFATAPHTWTTFVAIRRAFNTWRKQISDQLKKTPGLKPGKWNDFKLYLDGTHYDGGTTNTLVPVLYTTEAGDGDSNFKTYTLGEWNYATLVQPKLIDPDNDGGLEFDDNADSWDMHIVGKHKGSGNTTTDANGSQFFTNYSTVGVIRSWYDSRSLPQAQEPANTPTGGNGSEPGIRTDPLSNIFDVQDDDSEVIDLIETENDFRPYDINAVPGMDDGELQVQAIVDNSAGEPDIVTIPGFKAPCGLIRVQPSSNGGSVILLDVLVDGERI